MKCYMCGGTLIWQNDYDFEDYGMEGEGIVTTLVCTECGAWWEGYYKLSDEEEEK